MTDDTIKASITALESKRDQLDAQMDMADVGRGREDLDARSVFVGNVDYSAVPEEVATFFHECGEVNRVTILCDDKGEPKGHAYVEFSEAQAVKAALQLNGTELKGRVVHISQKRTNHPGFDRGGKGRRGGRGGRGGGRLTQGYTPYDSNAGGRARGRGRRGRGFRGGFGGGGGGGGGGAASGFNPWNQMMLNSMFTPGLFE